MAMARGLQRLWHWRTIFGLLAGLVLLAMVSWDWHSPGDRDPENPTSYWSHPASWFAEHTVTANAIQAALFGALAWVVFDHRAKKRDEIIADSTTSIGLAGAVQPLLGIVFALAWLGRNDRVGETGCTVAELRADQLTRSPLKWTREPVRAGCWPDQLTEQRLADVESGTVGECIREIVGTVRDWSNLLVASVLGREAAFCMQWLRVRLQELQRCIDAGEPPHDLLAQLRAQALYMAVAFEDSSGPVHRRSEVEHLLRRAWAQEDLTRAVRAVGLAAQGMDDWSTEQRATEGRRMVQSLFDHLRG
jgi:hypothetical protein